MTRPAGDVDVLSGLPPTCLDVYYDGRMIPGLHPELALAEGANCQRFAYTVLAHFGLHVPPWGSSELWSDNDLTELVDDPQPLDLALFAASDDAWGAHVGVVTGPDEVLHLCAELGRPVVWTFHEFALRERYRTCIGFKRVRR